ncbi:MAG: rane-bound PQQ-dependent dehydrogenase, glucose/quinate/shikimate family [Bradyrhizobium sp.]|nr:rane-bound PQQ-dependent dehydrogenase, glucose/quinate/shikimate family [Bradyrhizobium sp.]
MGRIIGCVTTRVAASLMGLTGAGLVWGGVLLIAAGGSVYYLPAGMLLLASAWSFWRGGRWGLMLYAALLAVSLVWSLGEVGFNIWGLLARLGFLAGLGLIAVLGHWSWRRTDRGACLSLSLTIAAVAGAILLSSPDPLTIGAGSASRASISVAPAPGDWSRYGGDAGGTRFSSLTDVGPANVARLQPAWIFRTGDLSPGPDQPKLHGPSILEGTPIQAGDQLFLCTARGAAVALDAETGRLRWRFDPHANVPTETHATCRGEAYHARPGVTGPCVARVFHGSVDGRLWALDAATGRPCGDFGANGSVNLRDGLSSPGIGYQMTSPGTVAGNLIVVGAWVSDNQSVAVPSGVIRAFDVVTGRLVWSWDMGRPDSPGAPAAGETYTPGTPNAWAPFSVDMALGLIYVPTGNPSPDYWGGARRPFDERYGSSIVALELATGRVRWSFQTTHHDLWDYDVPSQPVLVDIPTRGGVRPALVQATKRGDVFILDRRTGEAILPVAERAVPQGGAAGDHVSATQPFSAVSVRTPDLTEASMWGLSPLDQLWCRIQFRSVRYHGIFTPPGATPWIAYPGGFGATSWGGITVDPVRHLIVSNNSSVAFYMRLVPRGAAPGFARQRSNPVRYDWGPMEGTPFVAQIQPLISPLRVPCNQPPWGHVEAIDLASGKVVWRRPFGTARDSGPLGIASHLPVTIGVPSQGGAITTASGLTFIAAAADNYLRALDTRTGRELWRGRLPAGGQATPMTYRSPKSGRQFIVVSAGGHMLLATRPGDYVLAYALPR